MSEEDNKREIDVNALPKNTLHHLMPEKLDSERYASNGEKMLECRKCKVSPKEGSRPFAYTVLFNIYCPVCRQSGPENESIGTAVKEWNIQQSV